MRVLIRNGTRAYQSEVRETPAGGLVAGFPQRLTPTVDWTLLFGTCSRMLVAGFQDEHSADCSTHLTRSFGLGTTNGTLELEREYWLCVCVREEGQSAE